MKPDTYQGRVGTYDIRQSGIGYLLAFNNSQQTTTTYGRLLESLGRAHTVVRCCTGEILDEIEAGRILIGYNMLASYAYARVRAGARLGLVMPADYTIVLSRGAMIRSRQCRRRNPFRKLPSVRPGPDTGTARGFLLRICGGGCLPASRAQPPSYAQALPVPITIGPALLAVQDDERRRRFIADWSRSLVDMATR